MRWMAPLERREILLVLFSLTVFFFSYNIDNSLRLFGLDPESARGLVTGTIGFKPRKVIGKDGRKISGFRDPLEDDIFGSWGWDEGHVAGDGAERSQRKVMGKFDAMWVGKEEVGPVVGSSLGETTMNEGFWRWRDDIPQSKVVRHVPGAFPATISSNMNIINLA